VNGVIKPSFFASAALRAKTARSFVAGEKLWLTRFLFEPKNDGIVLEFLSDPFDDARYWGTLKFSFTKGAPPPTPAEFAKTVSQVFDVDSPAPGAPTAPAAPAPAAPEVGQTAVAGPAPSAVAQPVEAAPVETPAPVLADIPPPPPPPDQPPAPPPTVALGQTKDQVIAIIGQPLKIANLGTKQIYVYKDFKVTLTAGKVTNIE
jgi:hypothetical protein